MNIVTRDELVIAIVYVAVAGLVYESVKNDLRNMDPMEQLIIDAANEYNPRLMPLVMAIIIAIWPSVFLVGILKLIFTPVPRRGKK